MTVRVGMLKSGMTAEDHRLAVGVLALGAGSALQTRSGLVPGSAPTYTKVAGMTAKVSPFQAWIDGTSQSLQGGYPFTSDADENVTFADGDATRDRIDLVVARVYDSLYDASGQQAGAVMVVQGDYPVSGPAVAPAAPPNSIVLWEQPIPAGTTAGSGGINVANAQRRWAYTAAAGGVVPVRNQAERDAMAAYDGLYVARLDTGELERRHQGQWGSPGGVNDAWQSYVPTWVGTTNPAVGNGTLVGRYKRIGKTVFFQINQTFGSTTTYGTGTLRWGLPEVVAGAALLFTSTAFIAPSGSNPVQGTALQWNNNSFALYAPSGAADTRLAAVTQSAGGTPFGSGGTVRIQGAYEAA